MSLQKSYSRRRVENAQENTRKHLNLELIVSTIAGSTVGLIFGFSWVGAARGLGFGLLSFAATIGLAFLFHLLLSARNLNDDAEKQIIGLTDKIAQLTSNLPSIKIEIDEAIIQAPQYNLALCFLRLKLSNSTEQSPCIVDNWSLKLRVHNEDRASAATLNIPDWEIVEYVEVTSPKEIPVGSPYHFGDNGLPLVEAVRQSATDLRGLINEDHPLRRGYPKTGWVGFLVGVPTWKSATVEPAMSGQESYIVYKTNVVKNLTLEITDGHGKKHIETKSGSFDNETREFVKREPSKFFS